VHGDSASAVFCKQPLHAALPLSPSISFGALWLINTPPEQLHKEFDNGFQSFVPQTGWLALGFGFHSATSVRSSQCMCSKRIQNPFLQEKHAICHMHVFVLFLVHIHAKTTSFDLGTVSLHAGRLQFSQLQCAHMTHVSKQNRSIASISTKGK
jgi:hypothetical protein